MSQRPEDRLRDAVARLQKTRETAREIAERARREREDRARREREGGRP